MLSIFPELLTYQLLAPLMLRLVIGFIFIDFGWSKVTRQRAQKAVFFESINLKPGVLFVWIIGIIEILAGLFLLAGFMTQIGALISSIILLISLFLKKKHPDSFESSFGYLFLCLIIALSLLVSHPGFYSIDLGL